MYSHGFDFEKRLIPDHSKRSSLWEREMNRQKPEPLVHCICWLFPANQKANHKHWIVFSAYRVGVALHCALHNAVSNDDLHIACNAFWTAFLFVLALNSKNTEKFTHCFHCSCTLFGLVGFSGMMGVLSQWECILCIQFLWHFLLHFLHLIPCAIILLQTSQ